MAPILASPNTILFYLDFFAPVYIHNVSECDTDYRYRYPYSGQA